MSTNIDKNFEKTTTTPCKRCGGAGKFESLTHVEGGICFACNGAGGLRGMRLEVKVKQSVETARDAANVEFAQRAINAYIASGFLIRTEAGFNRKCYCGAERPVSLKYDRKLRDGFDFVDSTDCASCDALEIPET